MAHSTVCPYCAAVLKSANPVPPGKKVKCPKCEKPFVVGEDQAPGAATVRIPPEMVARALDHGAGGRDDADDAPRKGDNGGKPMPKKSSKGLLIGLIGGGLLLLTCCCAGVGGGGGW